MGILNPETLGVVTKQIGEYYNIGTSGAPSNIDRYVRKLAQTEAAIEEMPSEYEVLAFIERHFERLGYETRILQSNVMFLEVRRDLELFEVYIY